MARYQSHVQNELQAASAIYANSAELPGKLASSNN
jgi:hypothetical protein